MQDRTRVIEGKVVSRVSHRIKLLQKKPFMKIFKFLREKSTVFLDERTKKNLNFLSDTLGF